MTSRIEYIRRRKDVLDRQLKELESKKRFADRKAATRRRILLGALVEARMQEEPEFGEDMLRRLDATLTRNVDRKVFSLPPAGVRP